MLEAIGLGFSLRRKHLTECRTSCPVLALRDCGGGLSSPSAVRGRGPGRRR